MSTPNSIFQPKEGDHVLRCQCGTQIITGDVVNEGENEGLILLHYEGMRCSTKHNNFEFYTVGPEGTRLDTVRYVASELLKSVIAENK